MVDCFSLFTLEEKSGNCNGQQPCSGDAKTDDSQMMETVAVENFYRKLLETVAVEKQLILKGSYFSIQNSFA